MKFPVVKRLIEAINAHDLESLTATFARDFSSTWPAHTARSFAGSEEVRKNWESILAQFPDIQVSVTGYVESADEFWGEFHYLRPGASDMRGVTIVNVRTDQIVQSRFYMEEVDETSVPHPMPGVAGAPTTN